MGKVRRYKKKLARAAAATGTSVGGDGETQEQPRRTDYMELAEELLSLKRDGDDDDKMSVCSVMKSVKSSGGGESLKLKKDAKRYLKHAFLLKRLEKTQKSLNKKKKKKSNKNHEDDDDDDDDKVVGMSKQRVLDWSVGNTTNGKAAQGKVGATKKHGKGYQKKQNAQLAKDLALFSKKIKIQLKHPAQNINET